MKRAFGLLTARDTVHADICIVGAGPAGLAAAIRCKQLLPTASVLVLERGVDVGAHLLSARNIEVRALEELLPHWQTLDPPPSAPVPCPSILLLEASSHRSVSPHLLPNYLRYSHSFQFSLPAFSQWLSRIAQSLGVEVLTGFAVNDVLTSSRGYVRGVVTGAVGKSKDAFQDQGFQPSYDVEATQTIIAEGAKGLIADRMIREFKLRAAFDGERVPAEQTYGLGFKETWRVPSTQPGTHLYTFKWPLDTSTFGYGFAQTASEDYVEVGFVLGLDYKNPHLDPQQTFQQWKTHPVIRRLIDRGECVGFGCKPLAMGGLYSVPKLSFPGGVVAGCAGGLFNSAKGRGVHTAMKSGMLAAEAIAEMWPLQPGTDAVRLNELFRRSWVLRTQLWEELFATRNFRQGFYSNTTWGLVQAYLSTTFAKGRRHGFLVQPKGFACLDHERTLFPTDTKGVAYPGADGKLTFTKEQSLALSCNVFTPGNKPLIEVRPDRKAEAIKSLRDFGGMESRLCPTGALGLSETGSLVANSSKCILCKACEIKAPGEYLKVLNSEGGEGPN